MAVTESDKGTMTKVEGSSTPEAEVKTPDEVSTVSPKEKKVEEQPIYTQTQHDGLLQMATSEAGRLKTVAETERDEHKTKAEKAEALVEDIQAERDGLQTDIEGLTNDDPKKFDLVKRDKELRDAQRILKTATAELATQKKDNEGIVTTAKETMLEIAIWEAATEYKGGDPVRLKDSIADFEKKFNIKISSVEQIHSVAASKWEKADGKTPAKKGENEEKEPKEKLSLDLGGTHGGGEETEEQKLKKRYPKMFPK